MRLKLKVKDALFFENIRDAWTIIGEWIEDWKDARDARKTLKHPDRAIPYGWVKRKILMQKCAHPFLYYPTRKPEPCPFVFICDCGQNYHCPVCGWGQGAYPCQCTNEKIVVTPYLLENRDINQDWGTYT